MLEFLKDLFLHKDSFIGYMRGALLALGTIGITGVPTTKEGWLSLLAIAFAGMIRAGEKNEV
jgi:hypothetical protein